MRVFQIQDDWGFDHLKLATRDVPEPGPHEVLLKMKASSLNFRDLVVPDRGYGRKTGELPLIPISDGVGEAVAVGAGVTRVKIGDRVCPMFFQTWQSGEPSVAKMTGSLGAPLDGTMAEFMCLSEEGVARVPAFLTDEQAACLPCAALTAWSALTTCSTTRAGDRLLVQGTGGVALFALQFGKALGMHVTMISSSDEKLDRVTAMGADLAINYVADPEWGKVAAAKVGGDGYDHVLELGGEKTLPQSLRCIRPGGVLSMIGILSGNTMSTPLGLVITRQVRLQGVTVGHRDGFEAMVRAIELHRIVPQVDQVYGFEDLKAAMTALKAGRHFGKLCIRHD